MFKRVDFAWCTSHTILCLCVMSTMSVPEQWDGNSFVWECCPCSVSQTTVSDTNAKNAVMRLFDDITEHYVNAPKKKGETIIRIGTETKCGECMCIWTSTQTECVVFHHTYDDPLHNCFNQKTTCIPESNIFTVFKPERCLWATLTANTNLINWRTEAHVSMCKRKWI
jgi:hypothetical protein